MELGKRLQYLRRKQLGISQEELAEMCGVSRQAITKWENDESLPTLDKLMQLADIYDVTMDELLGRQSLNESDRFKRFIKKLIPRDNIFVDMGEDGDDICKVVSRYLLFAKEMKLSGEDSLRGLEKIFLADCEV